MNDKKEVKPVFVLPFGEEKLFLTAEFTKEDGIHKTVMILRKIEEKGAIPKEYMYDEEFVVMCAMNFKSKKSITNVIRFLRIFRDKVFGKTNKEFVDANDSAIKVDVKIKTTLIEDRCVMCGELIPEGRQVCPQCENRILSSDKRNIK